MSSQLLSVQVTCKEKTECLFDGQDMPIDIAIRNVSPFSIGLPQQYMQEKGPYLTLIDKETQAKAVLKTGLPKFALKKVFTTIKPGEVIHLSSILKAQEITEFRLKLIDVTALIELSAKVKVNDPALPPEHELSDFESSATLRILGKDTLELLNRK